VSLGPYLDVLNLINLLIFFRSELEQILGGDYVPGLFSKLDEERLSRLGIIERDEAGYVVPWEVETLLERIK